MKPILLKWIYILATLTFIGLAIAAILTGRGWEWAVICLMGGFATIVWGWITVKLTEWHIRKGQQQLEWQPKQQRREPPRDNMHQQ